MTVPLPFQWDGEAMRPVQGYAARADREFVIGAVYRLVEHQDRSLASHGHFFAAVNEAFQNLPPEHAGRWQSADHLRKWALIKAGYADERSIVCASKAEAQRLAGFIAPLDEYAIVAPSEAVVTVYTAKSQSMKAMGKAAFQDSKDKVLAILADLLGIEADSLLNARAA